VFGFPGSGGVGLASSRPGSVEPQRFQLQGPHPLGPDVQTQPEVGSAQTEPEQATGEVDEMPPAVPKKIKKKPGVVQDTRTELRDDELLANRNNYLKVRRPLLLYLTMLLMCGRRSKESYELKWSCVARREMRLV
jgi:hypothetical protein